MDWADKVKGDCISKAINNIVKDSIAHGSQNGNDVSFENGGTGDAKSRISRSAKRRNVRLTESENRPPSQNKVHDYQEKGSLLKKNIVTSSSRGIMSINSEKPNFRIKSSSNSGSQHRHSKIQLNNMGPPG